MCRRRRGLRNGSTAPTKEGRHGHHRRLGPAHQPADAAEDGRLVRRGRDPGRRAGHARVRGAAVRGRPVHARRRVGRPDAGRRRAVDAARAASRCARRRDEGGGLRRALRAGAGRRLPADRAPRRVEAVPDEAHSVRAELDGLGPGTSTSTASSSAPRSARRAHAHRAAAGAVASLAFAFVSCQNFPDGYFTPYADVVDAADLDAVIHLGDYIYEGPAATFGRTSRCARSSRSTTTGSATASTRPTSTCRPRTPRCRGWSPGTTTRSTTTTPTGLRPRRAARGVRARRAAAAYRAYWEHMPLRRARKPVDAVLPALPPLPLGRRS